MGFASAFKGRTSSCEWRFVVACCRHVSGYGGPGIVAEAAPGVAWDEVAKVARRHRVEGLVSRALRSAGLPVPDALAAAAEGIVRQNLVHAAEAKRLDSLLDSAGIDRLFVKGATLDRLAWGSLALKRSIDIDLLIAPAGVAAAAALLRGAGYRCTHPGDRPVSEIERYTSIHKDSVWRHDARGVTVELLERLTAHPALLRVHVRSPRRTVEVANGIALPTLADGPLFAYLCVHGALTAWSRLKWPAHLAAFLHDRDVGLLYREAIGLAPRRAVAQALLVCHALFDLPLDERLLAELRSDSRARWLARTALRTMVRGGAATELSDQRLGTARLHFSLLFLKRGWRYKASELRRQLIRLRAA